MVKCPACLSEQLESSSVCAQCGATIESDSEQTETWQQPERLHQGMRVAADGGDSEGQFASGTRTLGRYRVIELLGKGGMGEVYSAEDPKLARRVALKIVPSHLASSDSWRQLEREAKSVAAINHPSIVHIYSIEDVDGTPFITMELVDGQPLSQLIPDNGFSPERLLAIAIPLVDAVNSAHEVGIIHRDLKPGNVMLTNDGRVKVLDFGLAKAVNARRGNDDLPIDGATTDEGLIVGSLPYMSPEQTCGDTVDQRTDVFSLGVILYKLASGRHPFDGTSAASVRSAILTKEAAPLTDSKHGTLPKLAEIIQQCLAKNRSARIQTAEELLDRLNDLKSAAAEVPRSRVTARRLAIAALTVVAASIVGVWVRNSRIEGGDAIQLINRKRISSERGLEDYPSWSPGAELTYESNAGSNPFAGEWAIFVAAGESSTPTKLATGRLPAWSPDGNQIAFLSEQGGEWGLSVVPAEGGDPRRVIGLPRIGSFPQGLPQWRSDTNIMVRLTDAEEGDTVLGIVDATDGEIKRQIPMPDHQGNPLLDVCMSPNGEFIGYVEGIYGSFNPEVSRIWRARVTKERVVDVTPITEGKHKVRCPVWSPNGDLFFLSNRDGTMDIWRHDDSSGLSRVTSGEGIRSFAFSAAGERIVYSKGRMISNIWRVPILNDRMATWNDAEKLTDEDAYVQYVDVSRARREIVFDSDRKGNRDLWTMSLSGGGPTQLTFDAAPDGAPKWSPDGNYVAFRSFRDGNQDIYKIPATGGNAVRITDHPAEDSVPAWSVDGKKIVFVSRREGNRDIWIVDADGGEAEPVVLHDKQEYFPEYSPDGSWLVFQSNRDGKSRFWLKRTDGTEEHRLSARVGQMAVWAKDSSCVYYTGWSEPAGNIWATSVSDGQSRRLTDFKGKNGRFGWGKATDGDYIYFTWWEDRGDIWIADVHTDETQ